MENPALIWGTKEISASLPPSCLTDKKCVSSSPFLLSVHREPGLPDSETVVGRGEGWPKGQHWIHPQSLKITLPTPSGGSPGHPPRTPPRSTQCNQTQAGRRAFGLLKLDMAGSAILFCSYIWANGRHSCPWPHVGIYFHSPLAAWERWRGKKGNGDDPLLLSCNILCLAPLQSLLLFGEWPWLRDVGP